MSCKKTQVYFTYCLNKAKFLEDSRPSRIKLKIQKHPNNIKTTRAKWLFQKILKWSNHLSFRIKENPISQN